ncbi:MAG: heme lyase CcmF/NrfE family subunit, partial [Deferribacterales bacterium]|nr:heme lyase CcmF/NrfE family subunit [Deferribacterales bacterium]
LSYGVIASSFYNVSVDKVVAPGETISFYKYELKVGDLVIKEKQNYVSVYSPVKVYENGKYIITMTPERRFYNNNKEPFAEVSIHTKPQGDLYLILASYSKPENIIGIQAIFEPFIVWIWIGCAIMVLGGLHGIFPFKRK